MSIKPFKKVISCEDEKVNSSKDTIVKPFKIDSEKDVDTGETLESINNIMDSDNIESVVVGANFFSTFNGIMAAVFVFVVIAVLADTVDTLNSILTDGIMSKYIYLSGLIFLLVVLFLNVFSNIKQLRFIKNSKSIKEKFILQKENPTADIIPLANIILNEYSNSTDKEVIQSLEHIRSELNTSQIYKEIYRDLDFRLLSIMDTKAKSIIRKASMQAALSTAISPFPLFDMLLVLWRSIALTKEIATIYGFRPGGLSTIILLKQAVLNVAFAGVTELASEVTNEIAGSTLLSKFSYSAGQGVANGILLARLGHGIIEACRPIKNTEERGSFIKTIMLSIFKVFKSKEPNTN